MSKAKMVKRGRNVSKKPAGNQKAQEKDMPPPPPPPPPPEVTPPVVDAMEEDESTETWPPEKEEHLINLYQAETYLYNMAAPGYKNRAKREAAHRRFSIILGVSVDAVEKRLRSLRTAYGKYSTKYPSGSGATMKTSRAEFVLKHMAFLRNHITTRKTTVSMKDSKAKNAKTCEGNQDSDYSDDSDGGVPNGKAATTDNNEQNYVPYDRTEPYEGDEQTQDVGDEDDNENGEASASASRPHAAKKIRCLTPDNVKRQLLTSDDDEHNRRIIAAKQKAAAAEFRGKGKGKNRKASESTDRSEMFQKISDAITNYPPPATVQAPVDPDASDPDMLWAKLLGYKIKQMQNDVREEFKMFVDMQALQAVRGNWSVPSPTKMLPRPRPSPRTSPFKFVAPRAPTAASHTAAGGGATASASGPGVGAMTRTGTQQPAVTLTAEEFYDYCQQYGTADLEALGNMPTS